MCGLFDKHTNSMTMLRSSSPAMSEISVGSPSPPPVGQRPPHALATKSLHNAGFQLLPSVKRLKTCTESAQSRYFQAPLPPRRQSSNERMKSFSIADILGKREDILEPRRPGTPPPPPPPIIPTLLAVPSLLSSIPANHPLPLPAVGANAAPLLMLDLPSIHKVLPPSWADPSRGNIPSSASPLHPFLPPALLHYDQRLAWDYHRQLQEHFHAQAQLLRQMSMDPNIIPSEDGSERGGSRDSSSGGSRCCSPEVNVASDDDEEVHRRCDSKYSSRDRLSNAETEGSTASGVPAEKRSKNLNDTPLDALFQLSTKNFDEDQDPATLNIFATRPNPKKKRKSRTAFTNHQIFELEKRFLYQKYLSPADRDEIAAGLGLSNAQVITWFQNRRAKLKRDMEELKKDVESVKQLSAHKSLLENVNDLSILKTRPVSRHHQPREQPTEVILTAALTHGQLGTSTGTAAAGLSSVVQPQPNNTTTTSRLHLPPQQQQQQRQEPQPVHLITTNTCNNEMRENDHIDIIINSITNTTTTNAITPTGKIAIESSSLRSQSNSVQSQVNHMEQQQREHQLQQQSPTPPHQYQFNRNMQINNSRG